MVAPPNMAYFRQGIECIGAFGASGVEFTEREQRIDEGTNMLRSHNCRSEQV